MNLKRIIGAVALAGAVAVGGYYLLKGEPIELISETTEPEGDDERWTPEYKRKRHGVKATVTDHHGREFHFENFRLQDSYPGGSLYPLPGMGATFVDMEGFHRLFWINHIDRIKCNDYGGAEVKFNDGEEFTGKWVCSDDPFDFYYPRKEGDSETRAWGFGGMDSKRWYVHFRHCSSVDIDTSDAEPSLEKGIGMLDEIKHPKTIELIDGRSYSSDLGYIVDTRGAYGSCHWEDTMQKSFGFLPEGGGFNKWIPLKGVSEIELTGEFEPREYLAHYRMAVVRYNDGREETGSICLNSESFNGCWRKESRFREWDKFIIYDKRGAVLIPLDLVRKIIPRNLQAESIQEAKKNEP